MKAHKSWSYAPYRPPFFDDNEIYICRVEPGDGYIVFDWLDIGAQGYTIYYRIRNEETFRTAGSTGALTFRLDSLENGREYEFYVCAGEKRSRVRIAECGPAFGKVINYLHPEDTAYSFSGRYLCSPCLIRHPEGFLLASMDLFAPNYPQNLTLIYRSDDDGETWQYVSELFPCFWGRLFLYENDLYMLSCSTEYGDLLIGSSTDGGKTFCEPRVLLRGGGGKNGEAGIHKNPQPVVEFDGRIWNTLEWGSWGRGYHAVMVMSAPLGSDILEADNWTFSEPVKYDPNWEGVPKGESTGNIEGCLIPKDGILYNLTRYDMTQLTPNYGLIIAYTVDSKKPENPMVYSRCIGFPGNHSKFVIKYDTGTNKYYSIISRITGSQQARSRNLLSVMASDDLLHWRLLADLMDKTDCDPAKIGFQYVDFLIEGDEILYLCRTSMNYAHNFHDSNYSIFGRFSLAELR